MYDPKGFFYFRKYPMATNKTPMFHWGQATMLAALAGLFKEIKENDPGVFKQGIEPTINTKEACISH
jgi:hypothetical protein